jgi:chloramphenicol-sensitive protein RarD
MTTDPRGVGARERSVGLAYAFATYGFWGLFPLYLKSVARTPYLELLGHRITWAALFMAVLVALQGHRGQVLAALRSRRTLTVLGASTVLIAVNWLTYIVAVNSGRMLESSFGYYINPLVNVALGVLLLRERLAPAVWAAVAIAGAGVLWLGLHLGHPPWISLVLAFSFAFYGLLRKIAPVGPLIGLTVETLLLLPLAGGYLAYLVANKKAQFLSGDRGLDLLLLLAGPLTAIPLLWFAAAARRLPLSTIGFVQYLSPTLQFLLAVAVYKEAFDSAKAVAFACIWTALALFAWHSLRRRAPEPVTDA